MSTSKTTPKAAPGTGFAEDRRPTIIFIFGGNGDLAYRKLMPALYNLFLDNYLPEKYFICSIGRTPYSGTGAESYLGFVKKSISKFSRRKEGLAAKWKVFSKNIDYTDGDLMKEKIYKVMADKVKSIEKNWEVDANVIFYLSVAPQLAPTIAQLLHQSGLTNDATRSRIVFEKPFGHSLKSAKELNVLLSTMFKEQQIYRIDHYLGKETVQNILALRFANTWFEPMWNSHYIDHVQITAAEHIGVEGRGNYYEGAGALRDMVQNHMLQLLCMIAMEAPVSFAADEIRNKKADVLSAIRKWAPEEIQHNAVRGQYSAGWIEGKKMESYRQEKGVAPDSCVETFAAVKFYIDNWRWQGVPFYIRSGKAMHQKTTVVTIQFKPAPGYAFPPEAGETWRANRLTLSIQPKTEIRMRFQAKEPGPHMVLQPVNMTFNYNDAYGDNEPEAYETLLEDVIEGNATLFMRADQVEEAWKIIQPILDIWQLRTPIGFPNYAPDSWGPEDAEALIARDGRHWVSGDEELVIE